MIYNNKFDNLDIKPDIFIVPSLEIPNITETCGKEKRVLKGQLTEYKNKWHYVSDGYVEDGWFMDEEEEQWIDFFNCHGEIRNGNSISETLKKYNMQPYLFLQLQNKLPLNQHINQSFFDKHIFENYKSPELENLLQVIRSQDIKGETQKFGDRIEIELKRRNSIA